MTKEAETNPHPAIPELVNRLKKGEIDRREFVRSAAVLGMSATAAYALAGAAPKTAFAQGSPKKGGNLRVSMNVKEVSDPAIFDWSEKGNVARHVIEPMVRIDKNNVARPHLAESWSASDDLKTWTFRLRRGVKWSNGDEFGADDVIANFERWLDPATGSSNQGRFSAMTETVDTGKKDDDGKPVMSTRMASGALERVDDHTVRFHLNRPELSLPESMADYPALITHRSFEGGDWSKSPIGTGPFSLERFGVGEIAVLQNRNAPHWSGDVYLDRITYIDNGDDPAAEIAAFASGQVDANYQTSVEQVPTMRNLPNIEVQQAITAQTGVARMKITEKPFDNVKVRQALQACLDRHRILEVVYSGLGAPGYDHHVAPVHPEHAELPALEPDIAKAKRLLAEAGYPNGLKVKIDCVANPTWEQNTCKAIAEMVKPAGIDLEINIMPGGTYWDRWLTTPFGFTSWTHRALGVQVLNLAYRSGVAWNETSYNNPEFDKLLDEAGALVDVAERRKVMAKIEKVLQNDAVIAQTFWRSVFVSHSNRVKGMYAQVALEHHYNKVWLA
jgi:peptide/nickel transport system substrate-binding protein